MKAGGVRHCNTRLIAECLSTRLLILRCVFQLAGCGPTSVPLRNAIKVVACAQTLVLFMQLKDPVRKSCVRLHKCIVSSTVEALAVSLSQSDPSTAAF